MAPTGSGSATLSKPAKKVTGAGQKRTGFATNTAFDNQISGLPYPDSR